MALNNFEQITNEFSKLVTEFYEHLKLNSQRFFGKSKSFNYTIPIFSNIIKKALIKQDDEAQKRNVTFCTLKSTDEKNELKIGVYKRDSPESQGDKEKDVGDTIGENPNLGLKKKITMKPDEIDSEEEK